MHTKNPTFDIVTVGTPMVDIPVQVNTETMSLKTLSDLRIGSSNIVDDAKFADCFSLLNPPHDVYVAGGSAANTAVIASQLGSRAATMGRIGKDQQGCFFKDELLRHKVTPALSEIQSGRTGAILALIAQDAERTLCVNPGVNRGFSVTDVNENIVKGSMWSLIQGHLFRYEDTALEAIRQMISYSKNAGRYVALSLGSDLVVAAHRETIRGELARIDAVFGNLAEAQTLTQVEGISSIFDRLSNYVSNFVITLGSEGAVAKWGGEHHVIAGLSANAIDATGAGDSFAGGVLHGLSQGLSIRESLEGANRVAAKLVTQVGARLHDDPRRIRQLYNDGD